MSIFISYAHEDADEAISIYELLEEQGFSPWIDKQNLLPGQDLDIEIQRAIINCKIFIDCLSSHSVDKQGYVSTETKVADEVRRTVPEGIVIQLPVRLNDCAVPAMMNDLDILDYFADDGKTKLLEAVSQFFELETSDNTLASPTEPELIQVPAGNFLMGSNPKKDKSARSDEQPQHKVYLSEYQISKYPITNVEYQAFVFDMEQRYKSTREFEKYIPGNWDGTWYPKGFDDHPVVNITWMNANEYCSWLSEWTGKPYRLPTEAEWEKAARGKSGRIFPWGNRWYSNRCNSRENGINGTTPVGQYSPKGDSPFGIVDMVGNVSEWCLDWYDMKTYGQRTNDEVIDPHGGSQGAYKVLRGGAFSDGKDLTRCAFRGWNRPGYWGWFYGFRVVVPSAK